MVLARNKAALLIFFAVWAVYWNSLDGEFVFDDTSIVQDNPQIRSLGNIRQMVGSHYWQTVAGQGGLYRPVVVVSYALNYAAGELDPWGYHFVNVLLHALNAVLVWLVMRKLFGEGSFAFWSGLLFALHPIRTEGVAYVVGRAESLAALFFLLAWWLYLRGRWGPAAVAYLLAVLSKESAFTFLAVPALSDWVRGRKWDWRGYGVVAMAAAAALTLRYAVLGGVAPLAVSPGSNPLVGTDTVTRLLTATSVLGRYLWLLVWPVSLSADYSFHQIPPVTGPWSGWFLAVAALVGAMIWAFRRSRILFFCGAFLLVTLALTLNYLRPIGTIMGERLLYLPSLGFTCAVAYALGQVRHKQAATVGAVVLALLYGGRTVARNGDWKDHLALFSSAARVSPNSSLVQANLANALLYQRGDAAGAARHAREAIRIEPEDPAAHMTLGDACVKLGDFGCAVEAYALVERLAPGTAGAHEAGRRRETIRRGLGR